MHLRRVSANKHVEQKLDGTHTILDFTWNIRYHVRLNQHHNILQGRLRVGLTPAWAPRMPVITEDVGKSTP